MSPFPGVLTGSRRQQQECADAVMVAHTIVALGACSVPSGPSGSPVASAVSSQAEIAATTAAFSQAIVEASASGWTDATVSRVASFYTEDTVVFPPRGQPIRGAAAIRSYWARSPERRILSHSAVAERIDVSGDLATEYGQLRILSQVASAAPVEGRATYISIWRRVGGRWRKGLDTWW